MFNDVTTRRGVLRFHYRYTADSLPIQSDYLPFHSPVTPVQCAVHFGPVLTRCLSISRLKKIIASITGVARWLVYQ